MITLTEDKLDDLWGSVINLTMPATSQLEILAAIGDSSAVDELALDFDDNFWVVQPAFDSKLLTEREYTALNKLNAELNDMSGKENQSVWATESLKNNPRWTRIRRLARAALKEHQISRLQSSAAT